MHASWSGRAVGANRRLRPGKARWYKDPAYRAFQDSLTGTLLAARPKEPIRGKAKLYLRLSIGRRRDWDSLIKPVCDCLQTARIVEDDRQIRGRIVVDVEDHGHGEPDRIYLEVERA